MGQMIRKGEIPLKHIHAKIRNQPIDQLACAYKRDRQFDIIVIEQAPEEAVHISDDRKQQHIKAQGAAPEYVYQKAGHEAHGHPLLLPPHEAKRRGDDDQQVRLDGRERQLMEYGAFQQEADHYDNKSYDLSFHGLLSFAVFILGIQHLLLCRGDYQHFLQLAEIHGRRYISGAGQIVGIHFYFADIADKQAL